MHAPYTLYRPARATTPVIFSVPHSGRNYPDEFIASSGLDTGDLRSSEDLFVDLIMSHAPVCGAPLLVAQYPRAYVDLNRAREELDPALVHGAAPQRRNPRIAAGLGVIPRVVAESRVIAAGKITQDAAEARLRQVWDPYHAALRALVDQARAQFGWAVVVDCHSMPHAALAGLDDPLPQIVLGDRFGAAAQEDVVDHIAHALIDQGLCIGRNRPFAGAYIAQTYGTPRDHAHCVQIEIDRALYLDADPLVPGPKLAAFERQMRDVIAGICAITRQTIPIAAQ